MSFQALINSPGTYNTEPLSFMKGLGLASYRSQYPGYKAKGTLKQFRLCLGVKSEAVGGGIRPHKYAVHADQSRVCKMC